MLRRVSGDAGRLLLLAAFAASPTRTALCAGFAGALNAAAMRRVLFSGRLLSVFAIVEPHYARSPANTDAGRALTRPGRKPVCKHTGLPL